MASQDDIQTTNTGQEPSESGGFWSGVGKTVGRAFVGAHYVLTHPSESWQETKNNGRYIAETPGEAGLLFLQGGLNGAASVVGMVGAVGKVGINLLTFPARSAVNGIAKTFGAEEGPWKKITFDCTGYTQSLADRTGIVEGIETRQGTPLNNYQKTILFGSQALFEIPAFVAAAALTGGVAGGALAAARGGHVLTRAASAAKTAGSWTMPVQSIKPLKIGKLSGSIETGGVAYSMDTTWQHYDRDVTEARQTLIQALRLREEFSKNSNSATQQNPYAGLSKAISAESISPAFNNTQDVAQKLQNTERENTPEGPLMRGPENV